jgi:hypothetical protein
MTRTTRWQRFGSALGGAVVGTILSTLLSAFGRVISGSTLSMTICIGLSGFIGALMGRGSGILVGIILGALAVAFSHVIGGTIVGITCTIGGGTALGGYLRWHFAGLPKEVGSTRELSRRPLLPATPFQRKELAQPVLVRTTVTTGVPSFAIL